LVDFGLAKLHASTEEPAPTLARAAPPIALERGAVAAAVTVPARPPGPRAAPAPAPSGAPDLRAAPTPGQRTVTGTLLGTPLYLAPELWSGGRATPASDVFALGMVLHELALGAHPHDGLDAHELAQAVGGRELPEINESLQEFPRAVSRLIARATRRAPEERFANGTLFLAALESLDAVFSGFHNLSPIRGASKDEKDEAGLVMASLARMSDRSDQLIASVYEELFARRPELRMLFPSDLKHQRAKLAGALRFVIENLRNAEHVVTALEELGQRHVAYGVKVSDLSSLGEALMIALETHDPNPWDDVTRKAWHSAYDSIARAMSRGMQLATSEQQALRPGAPA
jgi:hemoglobin-like flavoprotein